MIVLNGAQGRSTKTTGFQVVVKKWDTLSFRGFAGLSRTIVPLASRSEPQDHPLKIGQSLHRRIVGSPEDPSIPNFFEIKIFDFDQGIVRNLVGL